jgi:hypothetical protein
MIEIDRPRDNPYAIDAERRRGLTQQLLIDHPPQGSEPVVCYRFDGNALEADIARSLEREVFEKSFQNDADMMAEEYASYESNSVFFLAVDRERQESIGALRAIENETNSLGDFKTIADLTEADRERFAPYYGVGDLSKLWDIGTVAVPKDYRNQAGPVSGILYYAMYTTAINRGIEHFVSVIYQPVYDKMKKFLGIPFEPLLDLPPEEYLGAQSQFVYGKADTFMDSVKRKRRKYIFVREIREATEPLVGKKKDALQFPERLS